jgi:hypothetical protein
MDAAALTDEHDVADNHLAIRDPLDSPLSPDARRRCREIAHCIKGLLGAPLVDDSDPDDHDHACQQHRCIDRFARTARAFNMPATMSISSFLLSAAPP